MGKEVGKIWYENDNNVTSDWDGACLGRRNYKARVHAEDISPALAWLKTRPELDASKVIMAGQSAGGYSTMYIASQNPAGVIGAIDFSGGRTDMTNAGGAGHLNQMMVNGFTELGKATRIPTFWVFAENDSRYTANTIRASHEAFQAVGGKARLLLSPPIEGDGHHIYHKPALWRGALKEYLTEIGVVTGRSKAIGQLEKSQPAQSE